MAFACNPSIKANILEVEFCVGYDSIHYRKFYEEIPIHKESDCDDSQRG